MASKKSSKAGGARTSWRTVAIVTATLLLVPCLAIIPLFIQNQLQDFGPVPMLTTLPEGVKRALDMQMDANRLLIGFSTSLIGGLAYYVKSRSDFIELSKTAIVALVASMVAAVTSVYAGIWWISATATQLLNSIFNPFSHATTLPRALQNVAFVAALIWAAIVVIVQERHRDLSSGRVES